MLDRTDLISDRRCRRCGSLLLDLGRLQGRRRDQLGRKLFVQTIIELVEVGRSESH